MNLRKHIYSILALLALLLAASGCNTVSVSSTQYLGGPVYSPTDPTTVEVLRTMPVKAHVQLGEIKLEPSTPDVPMPKIEDALRKRAASMGANAAVVVVDRIQVTGAMVVGGYLNRSVEQIQGRVIVAVAIRYQ